MHGGDVDVDRSALILRLAPKADARMLTTHRHRRRFDWGAPPSPRKVPSPSPPSGSPRPAAADEANDVEAAHCGQRAARARVRADSRGSRRHRARNGTTDAVAADDDGSDSCSTYYSEAEMAILKARLNALIGSGGGGGGG